MLRSQSGFKVIVSRDAVFSESEIPCLSKSPRKDEEYNIESTSNKVEKSIEDNQQGEEDREENKIPDNEFLENYENNNPNENQYLLARFRERREPRLPSKFKDFHLALNTESFELTTYDEALKSSKSNQWIKAMEEEMKSLHDNKTWVLVPKPKDASIVDCKWIFKIKQENNSSCFEARLVAKGFTKKV
ncbi:UNVERIFIED_CONTAM: hypothetical protein Slati_4280000 [Sesamum latifolium]|uniref:Mitochondrial protein n=1 Tax=Sesamum latifolium TaxID=2727402 RepID=A0AAW2TCM6_9LAMI